LIIGVSIFSNGYFIVKNNLNIKRAIQYLQIQIEDLQDQYNQLLDNEIELVKKDTIVKNVIDTLIKSNQTIDVKLLLKSNVFVRGFFGTGAGTVIKKTENRMYILTCYHVVEDIVKFNEMGLPMGATVGYSKTDELNTVVGMIVYGAKIIKSNKDKDLALLEVRIVDNELEARPIAENEPQKGDTVYSIGSPLGLLRTISKGILSNKEDGFYISDNTTTFGNSGGGLFNIKGELIGVPSNVTGYSAGTDKNGDEIFVPESGLGLSRDLSTVRSFLGDFLNEK